MIDGLSFSLIKRREKKKNKNLIIQETMNNQNSQYDTLTYRVLLVVVCACHIEI